MSTQVTPPPVPPAEQPAPAKKQRGRESTGDMVRSLGLVLIGVIALWFFAQSPSDEATIRPVDTAAPIASFQQLAPGAPVPTGVPEGYVPTSATPGDRSLRIGYVTPDEQYLEYAASTGARDEFLEDITGEGAPVADVEVAGTTWEQWRGAGDSTTLVREVEGTTVVVGGFRGTTDFQEIRDLAATVR